MEALERPTAAADDWSETEVCVQMVMRRAECIHLRGNKDVSQLFDLIAFCMLIRLCSAECRAVGQAGIPLLPSEQGMRPVMLFVSALQFKRQFPGCMWFLFGPFQPMPFYDSVIL